MKKFVMCAALVVGLISSSASAFATTYTYTSSGQSFNSSWSVPKSGTNWTMTYGYNTDWINEDFTHTYHSTTSHTAIVKNANGTHSDNAGAGSKAAIEVVHSGSSISYSIYY